nr:glutamate mutase L [Actinopolymorpha cephalotaxi]
MCVDFGSTFTKAALVDVPTGRLVATGSHRTTIGTDLMEALDVLRTDLAKATGDQPDWPVRACSSAGGGLRIAVVGNERLVTVEAGERVATSSGGRVVHVAAAILDSGALTALAASAPDLVLLVGGTDGGNTAVLRANARALADAATTSGSASAAPVVVAGNAACAPEVARVLTGAGVAAVVAGNVLPRIGVVCPDPARAAIREMFVRHVIGGKHLSRREEFARIVVGATPDLVLCGVEVLARTLGVPGVVVVDVGGATTDVHSVVEPDPEDAGLGREVVATLPVGRTVEGDLGLRWNAPQIVHAAVKAHLLDEVAAPEVEALRMEAERRKENPGFVATTQAEVDIDVRLAELAVKLALRRHAGRSQVVTGPAGPAVDRTGRDLREVGLLVGSGGLLRHVDSELARQVVATGLAGSGGHGRLVPERPDLAVDRDYVLAAVGLLAPDHPDAAATLVPAVRP